MQPGRSLRARTAPNKHCRRSGGSATARRAVLPVAEPSFLYRCRRCSRRSVQRSDGLALEPVPLQNAVMVPDLRVHGVIHAARRYSLMMPPSTFQRRGRGERHDGWLVMIGWPLVAGLVRSVAVVVPGVRAQYCVQMAFAVDQHPVRALGPHGPYPPFGIAVRPGCLRRGLHDSHALARQDIVETRG